MANVETVKLPYNKIGFVKNPLLVPTEIPVKNNWATVSTGKILADVSTEKSRGQQRLQLEK